MAPAMTISQAIDNFSGDFAIGRNFAAGTGVGAEAGATKGTGWGGGGRTGIAAGWAFGFIGLGFAGTGVEGAEPLLAAGAKPAAISCGVRARLGALGFGGKGSMGALDAFQSRTFG